MTGAHIAAIGAQHAISAIDGRVILRAALVACASAMIVGHSCSAAARGTEAKISCNAMTDRRELEGTSASVDCSPERGRGDSFNGDVRGRP